MDPESSRKTGLPCGNLKKRPICGLCAGGCGMVAQVDGDRIICIHGCIHGDKSHPVSRGRLCLKEESIKGV